MPPSPASPASPPSQTAPFDGKDKDKIPEDGWQVGCLSNTSSETLKVTLSFHLLHAPRVVSVHSPT